MRPHMGRSKIKELILTQEGGVTNYVRWKKQKRLQVASLNALHILDGTPDPNENEQIEDDSMKDESKNKNNTSTVEIADTNQR